jgi:hypothetical protein
LVSGTKGPFWKACFTRRSSCEWKRGSPRSRPRRGRSGRREQRLELAELVVHGDAQGLERAGRRVDAADAHRPHGAHDGAAEVERGLELTVRRPLDAAGDAARSALVAVAEDDVGELVVESSTR